MPVSKQVVEREIIEEHEYQGHSLTNNSRDMPDKAETKFDQEREN